MTPPTTATSPVGTPTTASGSLSVRSRAGRSAAGRQPLPRAAARTPGQVARHVPRAQSLPVERTDTGQGRLQVGVTDLGRISVADSVVGKIASRAAVEVDDVGAAPTGILGALGVGSARIGALPTAKATVDGQLAFIDLTISVKYPTSVRLASESVRNHVRERIGHLAGLQVPEVDITVPALVADLPQPRRVR